MKKIIISFIVFVVAALLIAPWFVGKKAEKMYGSYVVQLNQSEVGQDMTFALKDYHRGWFHSTAVLSATLKNTALSDSQAAILLDAKDKTLPSFTIKQTIAHGPILLQHHRNSMRLAVGVAKVDSQFFLPKNINKTLAAAYGGKAIADIETTLYFKKTIGVHVVTPEATFADGSDAWYWGGGYIDVKVDFASPATQIKGYAKYAKLAFEKGNDKNYVVVDNISKHFDWVMAEDGTMTGKSTLKVPSAEIDGKSVFKGLIVHFAKSKDSKDVGLNLRITMQSFDMLPTQKFGPFSLSYAANNLNTAAWSQLQTYFEAQAGSQDPQDNTVLMQHLYALIQPTTVLDHQLQVTLPQGELNGAVAFSWPKVDKVTAENVQQSLYTDFSIKAPESMVEQAAALSCLFIPDAKALLGSCNTAAEIKTMIDKGYLIKENNDLKTTIKGFSDALLINGKPLPLPQEPKQ